MKHERNGDDLSIWICGANPPEGLRPFQPALIWRNGRQIFEAPTFFLADHYAKSGRRASPGTWKNAAYALLSWFKFLSATDISDWRDASSIDIANFRDAFSAAISPQTGEVYSSGSVTNAMTVIGAWYAYAALNGWYSGDLDGTPLSLPPSKPRPLDSNPLVHTQGGKSVRVQNTLLLDLLPARERSRHVHPFRPDEMRAFLNAIGPRASARNGDERPSRDRLLVDIGWAVGLRLDEIHQLSIYQFLHLNPPPHAPAGQQELVVSGKGSRGSGKRKRTVAIPNWVVQDAIHYIDTERKAVMGAGRRATTSLIVSGRSANRAGAPISHRRFQQIVQEGCIKAGLVETVPFNDVESGQVFERTRVRHSVHDLRHTYAVFTYWAERRAGNPEPWKKIQAQLGHKSLSTTTNTYLSHTEIFDESGVDLRAILEG